jgi:hypothetical protein
VADAGQGECAAYIEEARVSEEACHNETEEHHNREKTPLVDVFIATVTTQQVQCRRKTHMDIMDMVVSPSARIIALCDLFGSTIWCVESLETLYSMAKGDATFSMKLIHRVERASCTLVSNDQRGTISWWDFDLPTKRRNRILWKDKESQLGESKTADGGNGMERGKKKKNVKKKKKKKKNDTDTVPKAGKEDC